MGAWGTETFENDTALDWAHTFMLNKPVDFIKTSLNSIYSDSFEEIRAIAYILEVLSPIWPEPYEDYEQMTNKVSKLLEEMLASDSEYLELWLEEDHEKVKMEIQSQINRLTKKNNLN